MEHIKNSSKDKYLLPISIIIAALLISGSLIYSTGKKVVGDAETVPTVDNGNNGGNGGGIQQGAVENMSPITKSDHIWGDINAPVKIVVYSDLECPFCKQFHFTLENVKSIYGNQVAVVFRHFPLASLHSKAPQEAQASECAAKLGGNDAFWKFIGKIFEVTPSNNGLDLAELPKIAEQIGLNKADFEKCVASGYGKDIVEKQYNDAVAAGGQGTPYSIVVNNADKRYPVGGAFPLEEMKKVIDQAIKEGK